MSSEHSFNYMHLSNIELVEKLYQQFLNDPLSLETSWRYFFEGVGFGEYIKRSAREGSQEISRTLRIYHLIEAYRKFGHLQAHVNPLAIASKKVEELSLKRLRFKNEELDKLFPTCGLLSEEEASLAKIIERLEEIYCGSKGVEYIGFHSPTMEEWLQKEIEPTQFKPNFSIEEKKRILELLNKAELFETFLHTKYVGQKRFSLEGGETLIPILNEIVEKGSSLGMDEFVLGMAHRGRLNVLVNILHKSFSMVFSEFEDYVDPNLVEGAGDVKYHKGFSSNITTTKGLPVHISLTANPSHLESVDPIVEGKVRAKQQQRQDVNREKVIPILIHGDASFAGQGVVYETMQFYNLEGYSTGGTIHIVVNNHIGFTTLPKEYCSTRHCTDIGIGFGFPIFHVNAEDPEGCILATQLAVLLRQKFHCDVIIELNCYRKYGHNESDEPAFTQPVQYQAIRQKKSIRELYRDQLVNQGILEKQMALTLEEEFKKALHFELEELKINKDLSMNEAFGGVWKQFKKASKHELFQPANTAVNVEVLKIIARQSLQFPNGLELHKKLLKLIDERQKMGEGTLPIDWAMGEWLGFSSLLWENYHVRLSGQDSQRGTFTQRHIVWVDQKSGDKYFPLSNLKEEQGVFSVYNSPLSEYGGLGFEWGYSLAYPEALVLWEAQFGDFANGAQIIFDQYIAASAHKWQRYSGLTILLPHGYEGQGAEHSSARLERFLQLASESNFQVTYPTTPAQYFHLLRRQVKRNIRVPLIVLTPKGLLRHPDCVSSLEELSKGRFYEVLDDKDNQEKATRLLICSGRIYYNLKQERAKRKADHVAIVRLEQLYPLHHDALLAVLKKYTDVNEYYWVQEEPRNMGAFSYIHPILHELLPKKTSLQYVGRNRSAATATGSHTLHEKEQEQLMNMAFG